MQNGNLFLLKTKLRKPSFAGDIISRPGLLKRLDAGTCLPLVLVVAPAGYGKTTILSAWLENNTRPYAWLSLNEHDNNLNIFLAYFLASVKSLFPDVCKNSSSILSGSITPPLEYLTSSLINEIDEIENDFILVLDDYHCVRDMAIHNFLSEMLRHPLRHLHMVISTRRDPPLPLVNLRAQRRMAEIRVPDMRLSLSETANFLKKTMSLSLDDKTTLILQEKTEGWIAALYLMALSIGQNSDISRIPDLVKGKDSILLDYLTGEVFSRLPPDIQKFMLKISIMDNFCASLCDAICQDLESDSPSVSSMQYLQWIEKENLFIYPVDDEHLWYRFHQLFHHFLDLQLKKAYHANELAGFHTRASQWLAQHNLFEEAIPHALAAGNAALALQQAAQYRHDLRTLKQWLAMEHLVQLFPTQIIDSSPDLLIAEAWIMSARFQMDKLTSILEQVETLLSRIDIDMETPKAHLLRAEINALRSFQIYKDGNYRQTLVCAEQALKELPEQWGYTRTLIRINMATAYQVKGDLQMAVAILNDNDSNSKIYYNSDPEVYLYEQIGLCSIYLISGDLPNLQTAASRAMAVCNSHNLESNISIIHYYLGVASYFKNELDEAEPHFTYVFERKHSTPILAVVNCGIYLSLIHCAQGNLHKSREIVEKVTEYLLATGNNNMLPIIQIFSAELSLLSGDLQSAVKVAKRFTSQPFPPVLGFYLPRFTLVKICLAQNTSQSLLQAEELLSSLHRLTESTHNNRFLMDILAMESILSERSGDDKSALSFLNQALDIARDSGFIRNFLDIGPELANMLRRLDQSNDPFVQQLLEAFLHEVPLKMPADTKISAAELTDREIKVLELLGQRLSNKEIAGQMCISPGTVKSHTIRIYQKLNAVSRRKAVEKAVSIGIIAKTFTFLLFLSIIISSSFNPNNLF